MKVTTEMDWNEGVAVPYTRNVVLSALMNDAVCFSLNIEITKCCTARLASSFILTPVRFRNIAIDVLFLFHTYSNYANNVVH